MMKNTAFAVVSISVLAASLAACETGDPGTARIGGTNDGIVGTYEEAAEGEWDGVVAVMIDDDPWPCTGTLIDPEVVLTAAHCVEGYSSFAVRSGVDMETALAGVTIATPCADYDGTYCDLAVLKLDHAVSAIPFFGVVQDALPEVGTAGKLLGYGVTSTWGEDYGVLRVGDSNVLDYPSYYGDAIVEIGGEAGHCYGDSGGPYFVQEDGAWRVDAVSSFGETEDCTYADGSFSTNTVPYIDWIQAQVMELTGHGLLEPGDVGDAGTDSDGGEDDAGAIDSDPDSDVDEDAGSDADGDTDADADSDADAGDDAGDGGIAGSSDDGSCDCAFVGTRGRGEGPRFLAEIL
jgi:hypothetical protein